MRASSCARDANASVFHHRPSVGSGARRRSGIAVGTAYDANIRRTLHAIRWQGDGRVRAHCRIAERMGESGAHLGPVHSRQALGGTAVALGSSMEHSEALCGALRHSGRASPSSTRHGGRKPIDAYRRLHMQQMLTHRHAHTRARTHMRAHTDVHTQTHMRARRHRRPHRHAHAPAHSRTHAHPRRLSEPSVSVCNALNAQTQAFRMAL